MTRTLGELSPSERARIQATIHAEAQAANWHTLGNQAKGAMYRDWEERFDLKHSALKDQIMKGFDTAQHIAPSGEAAVHLRVKKLFEDSAIPWTADKVASWDGRGVVDFVLGFSENWVVAAVELESAVNWQQGLLQALWYKASYFKHSGLEVLPCLVLFGSVTTARWEEIKATCTSMNVLLLAHDLRVDGKPEEEKSLARLL